MAPALLLDANLLVLLLVGATSPPLIERHKRLRAFVAADYDLLREALSAARAVCVTPNIATEALNIARLIDEPARTGITATFVAIMPNLAEHYVASITASQRPEFLRLGLADATMLDLADTGAELLTVDFDLYAAAWRAGRAAVNFNHLRTGRTV
jgi:hypothetical protein